MYVINENLEENGLRIFNALDILKGCILKWDIHVYYGQMRNESVHISYERQFYHKMMLRSEAEWTHGISVRYGYEEPVA